MKKALITGATGGLGEALARECAKHGLDLILTGRDEKHLSSLANELRAQVNVMCHAADLTHPESIIPLVHAHVPDLIINNAGFGLYGRAVDLPLASQQEMIDVNMKALVALTLEGAKAMLHANKKGTILNVSSAAGFFVYPTFAIYSASKTFVNHFSQAVDAEVREQGVRVLVACPGQIETGFRNRASRGYPQKKEGYTMTPDHVAKLIWSQIEKGKSLEIIDWRYRLLTRMGQLVPQRWLQRPLRNTLLGRYQLGQDQLH
jgi:short-subunit dehydrogenase